MQTNDTVVQFSGLKTGTYTYHYTLDDTFFETFENEEVRQGTVEFKVVLEKKERMLVFHFSFHGTMATTCDRCLGPMVVPVEGERIMCVKLSDDAPEEDEEMTIVPEQTFQIDLAQWMYEYVVMAMPMCHAHDEADCDPDMLQRLDRQQSDAQAEQQAVDPRWAALLNLKEEK